MKIADYTAPIQTQSLKKQSKEQKQEHTQDRHGGGGGGGGNATSRARLVCNNLFTYLCIFFYPTLAIQRHVAQT